MPPAPFGKERRKLTGLEKASTMLLALPEELSAKIFNALHTDEIHEIAHSMMTLGSVKSQTVDSMVSEFAKELSNTGSLLGTLENTQRLLKKILPKPIVDNILEEVQGPGGRTIWDKLSNINEEFLANYLKNERPQSVSLILSKMRPDSASKVLALLPDDIAINVSLRMIGTDRIRKEIVEEVEKTLREEFIANPDRLAKKDSYATVAEIFNSMDRSCESRLLKGIEGKSPEAAQKIRNLMFGFEDLIVLDDNSIQILMRNVDKNKLAMALKGADEDLKGMFLKNMSERAARLMNDDMKSMGMVRMKDVEEAQLSIVITAKELAAMGHIMISNTKDPGDELVG